jgi:site-specific DNA-cytosine methylase
MENIVNIPSTDSEADESLVDLHARAVVLSCGKARDDDSKGKLFYEYIKILKTKSRNIMSQKTFGHNFSNHLPEIEKIIERIKEIGYDVVYKVLDAKIRVCQERKGSSMLVS